MALKSIVATPNARQRLASSPPGKVYTLEPAKAARLRAKTMLVPSPLEIRDAIAKIAPGETRAFDDLRKDLAEAACAEISCPRSTTIGWFLVAQAAEEEAAEGANEVVGWWRITRGRKPDPRLPGGAERQRSLLAGEGVSI